MKYSQKTLHSSPERARYGVSFVSSKGNILCRLVKIELYKIFAIINRAIKGLHCNVENVSILWHHHEGTAVYAQQSIFILIFSHTKPRMISECIHFLVSYITQCSIEIQGNLIQGGMLLIHSKLKPHRNDRVLLFATRPEDHYELLHMARQQCCHDMSKHL